MTSRSAVLSTQARSRWAPRSVTTTVDLRRAGWFEAAIRAQVSAGRWQRFGRAVVLHNGPISRDDLAWVALANCGPQAALTGFIAARIRGLTGWDREWVDVLVPGGARVRRVEGVPMRVHWVGNWAEQRIRDNLHSTAAAVVIAAGSFSSPRAACGIIAASVQQRLLRPTHLRDELTRTSRIRHHRLLLHSVDDIEQGSTSLSEIDFVGLCRRNQLPPPIQQSVRVEPSGRRRYLDAEWIDNRGRRVVAEVDGALHLAPRRWWDDQLRQNELVIAGDVVLRFPSVILRCEERTVAGQLRRALTNER